ncbi:PREDICTED: calcium-responsive transcription factor-like [Branchiostoma belcheri]|uniref:Calcium-responsive transcription factor-like n=1 Tax=Branchiostoma belcheri TaxID=7741 RepID=A0A6P4XV79_BRABE|nr:PREDICTED: calcium-responsive transcription factor-like [Branchiostoma belcheri]
MSAEDDQMQVVHHAITGVTEIVSSGSTDDTGTTGTAIYQQDDTDRPVAVTQAAPGQPMEVVQIIPVSTEGSMGQMTVSGAVAQMIALNGGDGSQGQLYHVIPVSQSAVGQAQAPHMITVSQSADSQENTHEHTDPQDPTQSVEIIHDLTQATATLERLPGEGMATVSLEKLASDDVATITLVSPPPQQTLPDGCPPWAARLRGVEKIGDSFRGWVENDVELDLLLTYHKQQTQSFWGTRQSPTPGKPSTRLMWKSQYVPFDGIPFVNIGSRAIVQECQFGPRRKGIVAKKIAEQERSGKQGFKATCPARIYIKKVRKFPQFRVHLSQDMDRKALRQAQERAFRSLKESGLEHGGEERQYVQLPTPEAHQFHDEVQDHVLADFSVCNMEAASRLHPRVSAKIRELVAAGMSEVYQVRKAVRKFVEKELFGGSDSVPERHNLSYFPTVNDIQNHVHLAQMAIERGELAVTAVTTAEVAPDNSLENAAHELQSQLWPTACHPAGCGEGDGPHTQTVTVTLTTNHGREHVVSQVETTMSDGTTLVSDSLTPETAQLLSALNPKIFQTQSEDEMSRKESETGASVNMEAAKGYDEELGQSQILIQDKISGQFCTNQTAHTIPLTVTNEDVGQALPAHFLTNSRTVNTEAANLLQTGESMPNMENQQQTNAQESP